MAEGIPSRIFTELDEIAGLVGEGGGVNARLDALEALIYPDAYNLLSSGVATIPRLAASSTSTATLANQTLVLSYFTSRTAFTSTQVRVFSGGSAAGATPTLIRIGLYAIAANGDGTLVAATANDTTLFAATNTPYTRSWSASVGIVKGQRYALGQLCVTAAAAPTVPGANTLGGIAASGGVENARSPKCATQIAAQTDLPASFLDAASVGNIGGRPYAVILP